MKVKTFNFICGNPQRSGGGVLKKKVGGDLGRAKGSRALADSGSGRAVVVYLVREVADSQVCLFL